MSCPLVSGGAGQERASPWAHPWMTWLGEFPLGPPALWESAEEKKCKHLFKLRPTPVPLPGKSHGWRSLVGCSPWGR